MQQIIKILDIINMSDNIVRRCLVSINEHFRKVKHEQIFIPDENNLKLDRQHGIIKNFMRLTNKTLIGVNQIHINRREWIAGFLGLGLGYIFSQADDFMSDLLRSYKPVIKEGLIQEILRNSIIKEKLNEGLLDNVYKNSDIQYTLHQLLIWKAIRPQQQQLLRLSKQGIILLLNSEAAQKQIISVAANQINANTDLIGDASLNFLSSSTMDNIVASGLSYLLKSELFYNLLAGQFTSIFNLELMRDSNREHLYTIFKDRFMNW